MYIGIHLEIMKNYIPVSFCLLLLILAPATVTSQKKGDLKIASKPLFHDPVFDGAADPTVIWNREEKKWFMFYTNRCASKQGLDGVKWVHGTRIGIAESSDGGATWKYRDTCNILYRPDAGYTHWAPEVIENNGSYHMFLTYVPGVFSDWNHPRWIVHLTSKNLLDWEFRSKIALSSEKCIDACVFRLPDGLFRMYYNNEADRKSMYYADSRDLFSWTDSGKKVVGDQGGEGPNVFFWKGKAWMIIDNWNGLGVYFSDDFINWNRQENNILQEPGTGPDDGVKGQHACVLINDDRAFIFYFTHFGQAKGYQGINDFSRSRRSAIQVAELEFSDGRITCDRNKQVRINLKPPRKK
jgi:sucrose-6-phosphate hydrolase SacC (GH32 family)